MARSNLANAKPIALNPGSFATHDDYPPSAQRDGRPGTTAFRLNIGVDGRMQSCTITVSSGHADLDTATCTTIARRARFSPARDAKGDAIESTWSSRVKWVIADEE